MLSIVASCVGLEKAEVEDAILDGAQVRRYCNDALCLTVVLFVFRSMMIITDLFQIDRMEKFFAVDGLPHLMFYYQDTETPESGWCMMYCKVGLFNNRIWMCVHLIQLAFFLMCQCEDCRIWANTCSSYYLKIKYLNVFNLIQQGQSYETKRNT